MSATQYVRALELLEAEVGADLVSLDVQSGACFGFNEVAATIWQKLTVPKSFDQLQDELLKEYDVSSERCSVELRALLTDMIDHGLIREA